MAPQLIFGTASFGMDFTEFQDSESVKKVFEALKELGINRVDTGARYPPLNRGRSEQLIGEAIELSDSFIVDTKVYTSTANDGSGDLSREAMVESVNGSLERLRRPGVNVLYAHRHDPATPLEDQIRNFQEQIALGHCKVWGVSNHSPEVLQKLLDVCVEKGWQKPSWYQGNYNLVTRAIEWKLLPILRGHGISFIAYSTLATGFLTGKFANNEYADTRFGDNNPLGKYHQRAFGHESLIDGMKKFHEGVKQHGLTPVEVAIRWAAHHSALSDEDGMILGASKTAYLRDNVASIRKGPLPAEILKLADELWDVARAVRGEML